MQNRSLEESRKRWSAPDCWQVILSALSLLVAIAACVDQFAH